MTSHTRSREFEQSTENAVGSGGTSDPSQELQRNADQARRLLEFGDEAISRVLSLEPEQFLAQNRQQGGQ